MGSQPTAGRRLGPSYPDNAVIGIVAKGRVTKEECDSVLRPALEASLKRDAKSRLYYEIGCRFPGAGWADLEVGLDRLPQWERIAVVTDTAWNCRQPYVKGLTLMNNSIYNGWRMEDVWLDK